MLKKTIVFVLILMLALSVSIYDTTEVMAEEPDTFNLGILLPLTGTFAAVAETQRDGVLLAVQEFNERGGLDMPWGEVEIETTIEDDEADLNVGARRFQYLRDRGAHAVIGQTWAPLTFAINEVVKQDPIPYFPIAVTDKSAFEAGQPSETTWAVAYSPYTVGYMAGSAAINELGNEKIFFLARSDSWGFGIEEGVEAAAENYGAEIVGRNEVPVGTDDFTTVLREVSDSDADVFISAQFAADAIALLQQTHDMGISEEMTIFNAFVTNVVADGLPSEVRKDVYGMHYFYYDLAGFAEEEWVFEAGLYTERYESEYGNPPDAYATIGYIAASELLTRVEEAGSVDPLTISETIRENPDFNTVKGPGFWRKDQQAVYDNAAFLVRGLGEDEMEHEWDLFELISAQGGEEAYPTLEDLGY